MDKKVKFMSSKVHCSVSSAWIKSPDTLMLSEELNESLLLDYDGHSKELKGNIQLGQPFTAIALG